MIFAWNDQDPLCDDWKYHYENRKTKSVLLLSYKNDDINEQNLLPNELQTKEFRMRNVSILVNSHYFLISLKRMFAFYLRRLK